jgi:Hg(II)-responsive transcriptional regulator
MRISEVAAEAGVNVQTLRYYERRGLLRHPARTASGYRSYQGEAVRIVRFIKRAQDLGVTLDEIEELLGLAAGQPGSCDAAQRLAVEKMANLDEKIAMLRAMKRSLERLIKTCKPGERHRECPILDAMDGLA